VILVERYISDVRLSVRHRRDTSESILVVLTS
jgi:hypothetical protein